MATHADWIVNDSEDELDGAVEPRIKPGAKHESTRADSRQTISAISAFTSPHVSDHLYSNVHVSDVRQTVSSISNFPSPHGTSEYLYSNSQSSMLLESFSGLGSTISSMTSEGKSSNSAAVPSPSDSMIDSFASDRMNGASAKHAKMKPRPRPAYKGATVIAESTERPSTMESLQSSIPGFLTLNSKHSNGNIPGLVPAYGDSGLHSAPIASSTSLTLPSMVTVEKPSRPRPRPAYKGSAASDPMNVALTVSVDPHRVSNNMGPEPSSSKNAIPAPADTNFDAFSAGIAERAKTKARRKCTDSEKGFGNRTKRKAHNSMDSMELIDLSSEDETSQKKSEGNASTPDVDISGYHQSSKSTSSMSDSHRYFLEQSDAPASSLTDIDVCYEALATSTSKVSKRMETGGLGKDHSDADIAVRITGSTHRSSPPVLSRKKRQRVIIDDDDEEASVWVEHAKTTEVMSAASISNTMVGKKETKKQPMKKASRKKAKDSNDGPTSGKQKNMRKKVKNVEDMQVSSANVVGNNASIVYKSKEVVDDSDDELAMLPGSGSAMASVSMSIAHHSLSDPGSIFASADVSTVCSAPGTCEQSVLPSLATTETQWLPIPSIADRNSSIVDDRGQSLGKLSDHIPQPKPNVSKKNKKPEVATGVNTVGDKKSRQRKRGSKVASEVEKHPERRLIDDLLPPPKDQKSIDTIDLFPAAEKAEQEGVDDAMAVHLKTSTRTVVDQAEGCTPKSTSTIAREKALVEEHPKIASNKESVFNDRQNVKVAHASTPRPRAKLNHAVPRRGSVGDLIRRVSARSDSPLHSPLGSPASHHLRKATRSAISRIAPLHPNRHTPPPQPPRPPAPKKTKKMVELEERIDMELSETVEGWVCMSEEERTAMVRARRDFEMGYED